MRYKDNKFLNYQDKQRNGEVGGYWYDQQRSDRQVRRETENRLSIFYQRYLLKRVEKDWWVNLSTNDKKQIETSYYNQETMLQEEDRMNMWSNFEWFDTWKEWFESIAIEYKPDMVKYREAKLKKLGI
jgi:hypothetical protein